MFQLVAAGALSAALVPIVSGLHAHDQDARAWRVASTVTTLVLAVLLVLAILVAIAAPVLVPAFVSFDEAGEQQTVELTRIMLLSPIFLAAAGVATSILNAHGRFAASAIAPLVYNLVIIAAAVFIAPVLGVAGLAVGVVAGAVAHLAVQIRPLRGTGFRYRPEVDLSDPDWMEAFLHPKAATGVVVQLAQEMICGSPSGWFTPCTTVGTSSDVVGADRITYEAPA